MKSAESPVTVIPASSGDRPEPTLTRGGRQVNFHQLDRHVYRAEMLRSFACGQDDSAGLGGAFNPGQLFTQEFPF